MSFAERLKFYRKKIGYTQKQLADELGIPYQGISQYERGTRKPKYQTIEKIAKVLNCRTSDLIESKKEAELIISSFEDELGAGIGKRQYPFFITDHGDEINDAFEELEAPGALVKRYTEFIVKHPFLMQMLKEIKVDVEAVDWRKVRIKHGSQSEEIRISEFVENLETLSNEYIDMLKALLENAYGFDIEED